MISHPDWTDELGASLPLTCPQKPKESYLRKFDRPFNTTPVTQEEFANEGLKGPMYENFGS
jgi:hypothetical protein